MESLVKLDQTRSVEDFVYDNDRAIIISNKLVIDSVKNNDISGFLLAMILKSDFSLIFKPKYSEEFVEFELHEFNIKTQEIIYEDSKKLFDTLPLHANSALLLLAVSNNSLYQSIIINKTFSIFHLEAWHYDKFKELYVNNYFLDFTFEETVKDKSGVRLVTTEEHLEQERRISSELAFSMVHILDSATNLNIVKDMEVSTFPHNLLMDQAHNFISKSIPTCNVLSTEWLINTSKSEPLSKDFSKSIWIPTESGDFTLNYLYNNIENTLINNCFQINNQNNLTQPLGSDLNIICSHGAKNISELQILFQNGIPTYNLDSIIGSGRILVFFVCYSGSAKTEFFRNSITSLVKRFISLGYENIIAPVWALNGIIPKYWLPEFLDSMNNGETISNAVYNANMRVHAKFPTPVAWACLHLYGNPNFRIE